MTYGVVNDAGMPSEEDAIKIVQRAFALGIRWFDTARAYGKAEGILGRALSRFRDPCVRVITKLEMPGLSSSALEAAVHNAVNDSIARSCHELRCHTLDIVLLHRWEHRYGWKGAAWNRLVELQRLGRIEALGASVYRPAEAVEALNDANISHLQVPINVLDWRWREAKVQQMLRERSDVVVYGRSALLQGVLAHPSQRWPVTPHFDSSCCVKTLRELATRFRRRTVADLCLAYVRALDWIDALVIGCDTVHQMESNLELFSNPPLSREQCDELESELPKAPEFLLNPSKWSISHEPISVSAH